MGQRHARFFVAEATASRAPLCNQVPLRRPSPVLVLVTKDPPTSLYTTPVRPGASLLVDLAGPLVWSTCEGDHSPPPLSCQDPTCKLASAYHPPGFRKGPPPPLPQALQGPYNPFTRQCAAGDLLRTSLVANTVDTRNGLSPISLSIAASCAPRELLASLPSGSAGVAGLARSGLALPAQVAAERKARGNTFMLCLPRSGHGAAFFGAGTYDALPPELQVLTSSTSTMSYAPLVTKKDDPAYYIPVKGIAVGGAEVPLPGHALATGGVVLSTRVPCTELRPDVYRPVARAFDEALGRNGTRVSPPAGAPFELCYNSQALLFTKVGYEVPYIDLMLEGGTVLGSNSMVDVSDSTACFAFVEMKGAVKPGAAPAVAIGGFQMENNLLRFDLEKKQLGFTVLPYVTSCSSLSFIRTD